MTIDAKCIKSIYLGGITESLSGFDGKINRTISAVDKVFYDDSTLYRTYFDVLEFYRNIYSVTLVYEEVIQKIKI